MAFSFRKISKRFFIIINAVLAALLLSGAAVPWLNGHDWPWMGFLALAFPYVALLVFGFIFFWLLAKPRLMLISVLALLLCWKQVSVIFNLHLSAFNYKKQETTLRVLSWNVKIFEGNEKGAGPTATKGILSFIRKMDPDIVCLQEFNQYDEPKMGMDHISMLKACGYPYYIFSNDYEQLKGTYHSGVVIFSKLPIVGKGRVPFTETNESIIYADVLSGQDTVRVFTTHLLSFRFNKADRKNLDKIKDNAEFDSEVSKGLLSKLKKGFEYRAIQAQQLRILLDSCPYPEVLCADFNDVPNSYAYWHIRGDRKDAFLQKGFGIGRTFISLAPTLRIDDIFCDDRFSVEQFMVADERFSDHRPVVADLRLNKKP